MNPYANEDVMWQRLKDLQQEAENGRLYGARLPTVLDVALMLGQRAWWLAGLAMRRAPRRSALLVVKDEPGAGRHAA